jgi:hypothetical protein
MVYYVGVADKSLLPVRGMWQNMPDGFTGRL